MLDDEERRTSVLNDIRHRRDHIMSALRIQVRRGLVEDDDSRAHGDNPSECQALFLAPG